MGSASQAGQATSFYRRQEESAAGGSAYTGLFSSTAHTVGPWHRNLQHAGPPAALMLRAVERLGHVPAPGVVTRATMEILAPVPVADLRIEARVLREGRKVALCEASLYVRTRADATHRIDDPDPASAVARLTVWVQRIQTQPLDVPATPLEPAPSAEGERFPPPLGWERGYLDAVDWRWVDGALGKPGPATVWTRLTVDVVDGERPSPAQRVLAVADSGSGISSVADPRRLLFVNTELTVHLLRPPVGERIWMRSRTLLDSAGVGLATTVLGDRDGEIGRGGQSLFVESRG